MISWFKPIVSKLSTNNFKLQKGKLYLREGDLAFINIVMHYFSKTEIVSSCVFLLCYHRTQSFPSSFIYISVTNLVKVNSKSNLLILSASDGAIFFKQCLHIFFRNEITRTIYIWKSNSKISNYKVKFSIVLPRISINNLKWNIAIRAIYVLNF